MTRSDPWMIRPLRQDDLALFQALRLEALRHHPDAFGSSFEEEQGGDLSFWTGNLPNVTLGAFVDEVMVGTAALIVPPKMKQRHKGHVVGVFVAPPWRRTGLAARLTQRLIAPANANGLHILTLSVTVGNVAARRLYLNLGFVPYGTESASLKIGSQLLDAELMALVLDQH